MKLLQLLFSVLWGVGLLGNGILFFYIEWTYLRQSFAQIFNPFLHLQILGTLLITPLFWFFLGMAVLGYYAATCIEKQLKRNDQRPKNKTDKAVIKPSPIDQIQFNVLSPSLIQSASKQVDDLEAGYVEEQVNLLKWAIQSSQKVQFSYEKPDGEKSDHTVTPIEFKTVEQTLYLEGYCHLRQTKRIFGIEQIKSVRIVSPDETSYQPQASSQSISSPVFRTSPTQTSHQLPSLPENIDQTLRIDAPIQKRPYIRYHFNEIERITDAEWNNAQTLSKIYHELEFRSRKKAQVLRDRITHRLAQLHSQLADSTTTADSDAQISSDVFKYEKGVLRQCGYKVGTSGLPESQRRQILDSIFLQSLSYVDDISYLREWGEPNTARRLQKLVESIAAFTRNAKRRNVNSFSKAIQDWEADLAYLKRTYYDGHFSFQWPRTGISRL